MINCNFHTHCTFCDGADLAEDMVTAAIEQGLSALGFSSHSYNLPDLDFCMPRGMAANYQREIARLKEKYQGQIALFCGIEQDYYSEESTAPYEYVIGSVHSVRKEGRHLSVDHNAESLRYAVDSFYGGDFDRLAEEYFALVGNVVQKTGADIIGHFDLISKFSEACGYGESRRFLAAAEDAVKRLIPSGAPFEVNTGAMARGVRQVPYPSFAILKMIRQYGGDILFSSDCHSKTKLTFGFDQAEKLAVQAGFTSCLVWSKTGWQRVPLS